MFTLSICIIELGIIWMFCHINTELKNKENYWKQKYLHLKQQIKEIKDMNER